MEKKFKYKVRKPQTLGGVGRTPLHFNWKQALDNVQTGIMGIGMIPAVGNVADLVNAGISGARGIGSAVTGDFKGAKKHAANLGLSLASAIPIAGQAVAGTRMAVKAGSGAAKIAKTAKKTKQVKEVATRGKQMTDKIKTKPQANKSKSGMAINQAKNPEKEKVA